MVEQYALLSLTESKARIMSHLLMAVAELNEEIEFAHDDESQVIELCQLRDEVIEVIENMKYVL